MCVWQYCLLTMKSRHQLEFNTYVKTIGLHVNVVADNSPYACVAAHVHVDMRNRDEANLPSSLN